MKRVLLTAALCCAPVVGFAQWPPSGQFVSSGSTLYAPTMFVGAVPAPRTCAVLVVLTIEKGHSIEGPWTFGAFKAGGESPISVAKGSSLVGPIRVEVCDGNVTISNPENAQ